MKNKTKRKVLSFVLSFFLVFGMLGMLFFAETKAGFLDKDNLRNSLVKSNYINQVQEKVQEDLETLFKERGLDTELSKDILTYDAVYMEISNYMDAVFAEKEAKISTTEFEQNLQSVLVNHMESQGAYLSDKLNEGIAEVVKTAASSYSQYVTPKSVVTIASFREQINHNVFLLGMVSAAITVLLCVILLSLYRYKHHAMAYIIYSAIAAVILNGAGAIALAKTQILDELGIGPQYYLDYVNEFIKGSIREWYIVTAVGAAIVVLLFLLSGLLRNISKK